MVNKQEPALQEQLTNHFVFNFNGASVTNRRPVSTGLLNASTTRKAVARKGVKCAFFHSDEDNQGDEKKDDKEICLSPLPIILRGSAQEAVTRPHVISASRTDRTGQSQEVLNMEERRSSKTQVRDKKTTRGVLCPREPNERHFDVFCSQREREKFLKPGPSILHKKHE